MKEIFKAKENMGLTTWKNAPDGKIGEFISNTILNANSFEKLLK